MFRMTSFLGCLLLLTISLVVSEALAVNEFLSCDGDWDYWIKVIDEDFNDPTENFTYNGSAIQQLQQGVVLLTQIVDWQKGSLFFNIPYNVSAFKACFDFWIGDGIENLKNANADIPLPAPATGAPVKNTLGSAFPSVANPETWFPFQLSEASEVKIHIHNAFGQLVKTLNLGYQQSGHYLNKAEAAFWNGRNERGERVASGIYFYTMQTRNFTATGKVVILK